jgi:hypothetical protein
MILASAGSIRKFKKLPTTTVKEICQVVLSPKLGAFLFSSLFEISLERFI